MGKEKATLAELQQYLDNSASPALRDKIEDLMATDDSYIDMLESLDRNQEAGIGVAEVQQLSRTLSNTWKGPSKSKTRSLYSNLVAAAGIMIIAISAFLIGRNDKRASLNSFMEPYPNRIAMRSHTNEEQLIQLNEALEKYEEEKYSESAALLEAYMRISPEDPAAKLYNGISHLLLKNYDNAIAQLNHVIDHGDNIFLDAANYYKSLALVKIGDLRNAKLILQELANRPGEFNENAKDLLEHKKLQ